jgi:hypothetical protein
MKAVKMWGKQEMNAEIWLETNLQKSDSQA